MDFRQRRGLYQFLINRLRLPRGATAAITKGLAIATEPGVGDRRRAAAAPLLEGGVRFGVANAAGHRVIPPGELPGTEAVVAACRRIFAAARASGSLEASVGGAAKRFLVSVVERHETLLAEPAIRDFVLSPAVLAAAADYFGRMPILSDL